MKYAIALIALVVAAPSPAQEIQLPAIPVPPPYAVPNPLDLDIGLLPKAMPLRVIGRGHLSLTEFSKYNTRGACPGALHGILWRPKDEPDFDEGNVAVYYFRNLGRPTTVLDDQCPMGIKVAVPKALWGEALVDKTMSVVEKRNMVRRGFQHLNNLIKRIGRALRPDRN